MPSINQFFPQIDQFLLYWQIRQKQFVYRHVNWSSRDQCTWNCTRNGLDFGLYQSVININLDSKSENKPSAQ